MELKRWRWIMVLSVLTACAHPQPVAQVMMPGSGKFESAPPATLRVSLPYRFSRGGVELKVLSVEIARDPVSVLQVDCSFRETRGRAVSLDARSLMTAEADGQALEFHHFARNDQKGAASAFDVAAQEQGRLTLSYTVAHQPQELTLRFPTGKWWNSRS